MDDRSAEINTEAELKIVAEFLLNRKAFFIRNLCAACSRTLTNQITAGFVDPEPDGGGVVHEDELAVAAAETSTTTEAVARPKGKACRTGELDMEEGRGESGGLMEDEAERKEKGENVQLSREEGETKRCEAVKRKKNFVGLERVSGRIHNVLDGLELHIGVFNTAEQNKIVDFIYGLQEKGRKGELGDHTYCEPAKWMHGNGQVMIQFGCCYDYAMDKGERSPGILRNTVASPLPPLLKEIIKRMVRWHVLPPSCVPDSCIINICESGDSMLPHIYSRDFIRPFCTVPFLRKCRVIFGTDEQINDAGVFAVSSIIRLPVGSVLVFKGNAADLSKHAIPPVSTKRISITFWKTDESKQPTGFKQEQDLQDIQPLPHSPAAVVPRSSVNTTALGRLKEYVGISPQFRSARDSQGREGKYRWRRKNEKSPNRSERSVDDGQTSKKSNFSGGGPDGSAEQKSPVKSQGILSPPEHGRRPGTLATPERPGAPSMRVVHMDERKTVVCTDPGENSPDDRATPEYKTPAHSYHGARHKSMYRRY